jgi:hypothetical protein
MVGVAIILLAHPAILAGWACKKTGCAVFSRYMVFG